MHLLMVGKTPSLASSQICDARTSIVRADSADDGLAILRDETFDLVIVDITSLSEAGLAFIRRMRSAKNDTPLVALTGRNSGDRVRALGLGADDAVAASIDAAELRARISAVIRRHHGHSQSPLRAGDLSLSINRREIRFRDQTVKLTDKEYLMLELLILRKDQLVTKDMFLIHLYGWIDEPVARIIDVFICKLRRKLSAAGGDGLIATVPGHGYTIRDPTNTQLPTDLADNLYLLNSSV